jgi:hypothetical protein
MAKEWAAVLAAMLLPIGASGQTVVVDGDTLKLDGQRIRLHGIDAPELDQACDAGTPDPWRVTRWWRSSLGSRWSASRSTATATGAPWRAAMPAGRI